MTNGNKGRKPNVKIKKKCIIIIHGLQEHFNLPLLDNLILESIGVCSIVKIGKLPQKPRNFWGKANRSEKPTTLQALFSVVTWRGKLRCVEACVYGIKTIESIRPGVDNFYHVFRQIVLPHFVFLFFTIWARPLALVWYFTHGSSLQSRPNFCEWVLSIFWVKVIAAVFDFLWQQMAGERNKFVLRGWATVKRKETGVMQYKLWRLLIIPCPLPAPSIPTLN